MSRSKRPLALVSSLLCPCASFLCVRMCLGDRPYAQLLSLRYPKTTHSCCSTVLCGRTVQASDCSQSASQNASAQCRHHWPRPGAEPARRLCPYMFRFLHPHFPFCVVVSRPRCTVFFHANTIPQLDMLFKLTPVVRHTVVQARVSSHADHHSSCAKPPGPRCHHRLRRDAGCSSKPGLPSARRLHQYCAGSKPTRVPGAGDSGPWQRECGRQRTMCGTRGHRDCPERVSRFTPCLVPVQHLPLVLELRCTFSQFRSESLYHSCAVQYAHI